MCACGHPSVVHADRVGCTARWEHDSGSDVCPCEETEGGLDMTVSEMQPPRCFVCDHPLVSRTELNRRIDWATDVCDSCAEGPDDDDCWCSYGFYHGGDPRQFQPDEENPESEIAAWQLLCEAWDRGEQIQPDPEVHGPWIDPETGAVTIGARPSPDAVGTCSAIRSLGMGATYCGQHRPPADAWKSWPLRIEDLIASRAIEARAPVAGQRDGEGA
jgi:hypothetical protein